LTPKRFKKISEVAGRRQKYLSLVLENIHDRHNVSAILRSADAVGIDKVYLIYNTNKFPKIGKVSSGSAKKWVELFRFDNVKDCFAVLKKEKFKIYSTHINEGIKNHSLYEMDFTGKVALVFGNEHVGISEEARQLADKNFIIPMYGMIQSLNVSVAAAVCLYETLRQREIKDMYEKSGFTKKELNKKIQEYSKK